MPLQNAFDGLATEPKQDDTIASLNAINNKLPALENTVPENTAFGVPVRPIGQDITAISFARTAASLNSDELIAQFISGTTTASQANGNLNIVTGTGTNAEFFTRSVKSWQGSWRLRFSLVASQRIANQNLVVAMADLVGEGLAVTINSATSITVTQAGHTFDATSVGQFVNVGRISGANGVPGRYAIASVVAGVSYNLTVAGWPASGSCTATVFGHSYVRHLVNGTTATQMAVDAQRRGWASGDTAATINTTASPGTVVQAEITGRDVFWADSPRLSVANPLFTSRASRYENVPDDNLPLHLFIWSFNGSTAPASTTTWTLSFLAVEKFANQSVYLQGVRASGNVNALPVVQAQSGVTQNVAIGASINLVGDVGQQYRANATGAASTNPIVAAATTNAAIIKASAGRVLGWHLANTTASWVYYKLHNLTTLPAAGTGVFLTIAIPPNGISARSLEGGIAFTTGIGRTTVTGSADADSTAVAAGSIVGFINFV